MLSNQRKQNILEKLAKQTPGPVGAGAVRESREARQSAEKAGAGVYADVQRQASMPVSQTMSTRTRRSNLTKRLALQESRSSRSRMQTESQRWLRKRKKVTGPIL